MLLLTAAQCGGFAGFIRDHTLCAKACAIAGGDTKIEVMRGGFDCIFPIGIFSGGHFRQTKASTRVAVRIARAKSTFKTGHVGLLVAEFLAITFVLRKLLLK